MVIAWSVNNDFEPSEKLTHHLLDGMGPTGRVSGRGKPINQTAGALQVISELNSVECGASKPHTNMGDDPGAQRGLCVL